MKTTLKLTDEEQDMLGGKYGKTLQKAMQIIVGLGTIYDAERLIPVTSAQVAGVSYDNLGEAGLSFLESLAAEGITSRIPATLNPTGMDLKNWQALGIDADFAEKQLRVLRAYERLGIQTTCSCVPYLIGNQPTYGEHIAWSESSAVCFANSVLGARTNREGGPSALAAALTGRTAEYGYHLDQARQPTVRVIVESTPSSHTGFQTAYYGVLAKLIGKKTAQAGKKGIPWIEGIDQISIEELKSFSASLATYGGQALFHIQGRTPEADLFPPPRQTIKISNLEVQKEIQRLRNVVKDEIDFFTLGCPHLSLREIEKIAQLVKGKSVNVEFWLTTAREIKQAADQQGWTEIIEQSGIKFSCDTCCVVAPIRGRFKALATDSLKACYYGASKHQLAVAALSIEELIDLACSAGGKS